jgi:hypothetical protein
MTTQNLNLAASLYFDAATMTAGFIAARNADDDASKPAPHRGQPGRGRGSRRRNRIRCAVADETAIETESFVAVSGR